MPPDLLRPLNRPIHFLDLPLETRQKIYKRLLVSTAPLWVGSNGCYFDEQLSQDDKISLEILHLCRQIRYEAGEVFYESNIFAFTWRSLVDLNKMSLLVPASFSKIRHLRLSCATISEVELLLTFLFEREELYNNLSSIEILEVVHEGIWTRTTRRLMHIARVTSLWRPRVTVIIQTSPCGHAAQTPGVVVDALAGELELSVTPTEPYVRRQLADLIECPEVRDFYFDCHDSHTTLTSNTSLAQSRFWND